MRETLTLLFTDIVDSTLLNTRLGDAAMELVWAAHDRKARELIRAWNGREVGRSDGFFLLFNSANDALNFAHSYCLALRRLDVPLLARIGIHTGQVVLRQNDTDDVAQGAPSVEVDGIALPLAARLMSAARGGQILLSAECNSTLIASATDASARLHLRSHGHWRVKGIDDPVEIFESSVDRAEATPPPESDKAYRVTRVGADWVPARTVPNNLPAERDRFVGRQATLRRISDSLEDGTRLVSLLGTGGVGKTRLALQFGRTFLGDYPGGVWFCDLSVAQSLEGIVYAVSQALGVPVDKTDSIRQIGAAIGGRGPCLIILDNFEQLARHAEETLGLWLRAAPQAQVVVTSREVLGIEGEHSLVLDPLTSSEAETLLRVRMAAAGADTSLDPQDAVALLPLVELLDRLPLAIELAASRSRIMRPSELLARMHQRFKLLGTRGGRRDRQSTLRATLDWSWDLLPPFERSALAQASVFEGGFTLRAAEAVLVVGVEGGDGTEAWAADVVQALLEKSLIRRVGPDRFDMLRSVHAYATERLVEAGEPARDAAMRRHWKHFGSLTEQAAIAERCVEAENLVAACRRAIAAGECDEAADALVTAWAALNLTGPFRVAIEMAQDLSRVAHATSTQAAMTARWVAGAARYLAGDVVAAREDLEVSTWEDGPPSLKARAFGALGQLERSLGNLDRADELLESSLVFAEQTGDAGLICRAHNALGVLRLAQRQLDVAHRHLSRGLDIARAAGDVKQQVALLGNIGVVESGQGLDGSAAEQFRAALRIAHAIGDRRFEGNMRCNLGLICQQNAQYNEALAELQAALEIAQSTGLARLAANASCNLALVLERLGDDEAALQRSRESVRLADGLLDPTLAGHFRIYAGRLLARSGQGAEARETLVTAAKLLGDSADHPLLGLLACANAELAADAGDEALAHERLVYARQKALEMGGSARLELVQELDRIDKRLSSR